MSIHGTGKVQTTVEESVVEEIKIPDFQSIFYHESVVPVFEQDGDYLVEAENIEKMIESYASIGESVTEEEALVKLCEANKIEAVNIIKEMEVLYGEVSEKAVEVAIAGIEEAFQMVLEAKDEEDDKDGEKEEGKGGKKFVETIKAALKKIKEKIMEFIDRILALFKKDEKEVAKKAKAAKENVKDAEGEAKTFMLKTLKMPIKIFVFDEAAMPSAGSVEEVKEDFAKQVKAQYSKFGIGEGTISDAVKKVMTGDEVEVEVSEAGVDKLTDIHDKVLKDGYKGAADAKKSQMKYMKDLEKNLDMMESGKSPFNGIGNSEIMNAISREHVSYLSANIEVLIAQIKTIKGYSKYIEDTLSSKFGVSGSTEE